MEEWGGTNRVWHKFYNLRCNICQPLFPFFIRLFATLCQPIKFSINKEPSKIRKKISGNKNEPTIYSIT